MTFEICENLRLSFNPRETEGTEGVVRYTADESTFYKITDSGE
jgi:hypothetical protein